MEMALDNLTGSGVPKENIEGYRKDLVSAVMEYGGTESDVTAEMERGIITSSMRKGRNPRDVAWALTR